MERHRQVIQKHLNLQLLNICAGLINIIKSECVNKNKKQVWTPNWLTRRDTRGVRFYC